MSSDADLAIRVMELDDMTVLGLDGVMGEGASGQLADEVDRVLERHPATIVLDLSLLTSLDAAAADALSDAARSVHEHHSRLVIRQPSAEARAVLDLTGTSAVIEFTD
jgi:anti-anti-sigma factor